MRKEFLAVTALFLCLAVQSQVVYENHHSEVYNYLSRMAQKGLVVFNDNIRPLSRNYLAECLDTLQNKVSQLTRTEQAELRYYSQEFGVELAAHHRTASLDTTTTVSFFKKDQHKRFRSFLAEGKDFSAYIDPVLTAAYFRGTGKNYRQTSSGVNLWGYAGKHWAYQFFYNDMTESGTGLDTTRRWVPETGIIRKDTSRHKSLNDTEFRGGISYSWHNGSIGFGQDYVLWGYGENGRIVLSDKSPAYPYVRIDYQPFKWLRLNYMHAWISSNVIDSNRTYNTGNTAYTGKRLLFVPKFFATHSAQFTVSKGLDIALGESIIYSDRMDVGYLMPFMFFKLYDNNVSNSYIQAGSNGQLFLQVSSRNQVPKTHLYGTLFIDEIRIGAIFDPKKRRNQLGYTLGASSTDIAGIPYLTAGIEYTRVNPFVYSNLIPAQTYTNHGYSLGDWMGNNFDRLLCTLKYTPLPKLKCYFRYQYSRKGSPGTIPEQYFSEPQPPFLFGLQFTESELYGSISYEWIDNLSLFAWAKHIAHDDKMTNQQKNINLLSIGFTYGL